VIAAVFYCQTNASVTAHWWRSIVVRPPA